MSIYLYVHVHMLAQHITHHVEHVNICAPVSEYGVTQSLTPDHIVTASIHGKKQRHAIPTMPSVTPKRRSKVKLLVYCCFNCFHSLAASFKTSLMFMSGYLSLTSGIFSFKKMLYALGRTFFFSPGSTTFFAFFFAAGAPGAAVLSPSPPSVDATPPSFVEATSAAPSFFFLMLLLLMLRLLPMPVLLSVLHSFFFLVGRLPWLKLRGQLLLMLRGYTSRNGACRWFWFGRRESRRRRQIRDMLHGRFIKFRRDRCCAWTGRRPRSNHARALAIG